VATTVAGAAAVALAAAVVLLATAAFFGDVFLSDLRVPFLASIFFSTFFLIIGPSAKEYLGPPVILLYAGSGPAPAVGKLAASGSTTDSPGVTTGLGSVS